MEDRTERHDMMQGEINKQKFSVALLKVFNKGVFTDKTSEDAIRGVNRIKEYNIKRNIHDGII